MSCKGKCERFKAKKNSNNSSWYAQGLRRCSVCEMFIKWNENQYCPCCNYKLRTRSFRGFGIRKKYREKRIKRY